MHSSCFTFTTLTFLSTSPHPFFYLDPEGCTLSFVLKYIAPQSKECVKASKEGKPLAIKRKKNIK